VSTYIRKKAKKQSSENYCMEFLGEIFSELSLYFLVFLIILFLSSIVAVYIFTGFGLIFLLLPIAGVIYYDGFKKKAKPISGWRNQVNDISQAIETTEVIEHFHDDFENIRIPLLKYCNVISQRFEIVLLEDVVLNLERLIKNNQFVLHDLPYQMIDDVNIARKEYSFSQIKIAESYAILLSASKLKKSDIELVIQYVFQTIAQYEENFIHQEDRYLATLLNNQIN